MKIKQKKLKIDCNRRVQKAYKMREIIIVKE